LGSAPEFAEALGRNISKAATGELTPQQALDQAAEEWVKIVQKLGIDNQKAQYANFINGTRKLGYKDLGRIAAAVANFDRAGSECRGSQVILT
jgi:hypothetical protein